MPGTSNLAKSTNGNFLFLAGWFVDVGIRRRVPNVGALRI